MSPVSAVPVALTLGAAAGIVAGVVLVGIWRRIFGDHLNEKAGNT